MVLLEQSALPPWLRLVLSYWAAITIERIIHLHAPGPTTLIRMQWNRADAQSHGKNLLKNCTSESPPGWTAEAASTQALKFV
jgi:hypothetical protein